MSTGNRIFDFCKKLWPLNRSITGIGTRQTLIELKKIVRELKILNISSGKKVFDWSIPDEWKVKNAYIITPEGKKICDFKKNNLHLLNYSIGIQKKLNLATLQKNLYSIPRLPKAIPYKTSYYNKKWGFCISHNQKKKLKKGIYQVNIQAEHFKGRMSYGEIILKGKLKKEILLSTYICHPSLANNEISGPAVLIYLSKWIQKIKNRKYTYRIIFIPETIGSIAYLSKNFKKMKKNIIGGFNLTCLGDNRTFSYLPSRDGDTLSDKAVKNLLNKVYPKFKRYNWLDRGSDERQFCAPGIDLPIATVMRSKFGAYPEYHTSLDTLGRVVTSKGLNKSYDFLKLLIRNIESNIYIKSTKYCEPNLGKRNLYTKIGGLTKFDKSYVKQKKNRLYLDVLSYADGKHSYNDIANLCGLKLNELKSIIKKLLNNKLITITDYGE
tara:strand:- start:4481 stop:5794 length:1314 start_codon:yes stop_codon:yes gene_type:complete